MRFVEAWQAAGYEPLATFEAEGSRLGRSPVDVTEACLALAESIFERGFTRKRQGPEGEHGTARPRPLSRVDLASFYASPTRVATIASGRASGRAGEHDGVGPELRGGSWDGYGVEDEIALLVAKASGARGAS